MKKVRRRLILSEEEAEEVVKQWETNPMLKPRIAKVVVNIGVGESGDRLRRAERILKELTGQQSSVRKAKRTIKEFGIRKGEPIAVMVTLRRDRALQFLEKALEAVARRIKSTSFDDYGNVSFGIAEHIMLPGVKYDPNIGVFGMDVSVSLERPGYRVMRRKIKKSRIPRRHRVSKREALAFFMKELNVRVI